jgi:hypothetical protein
MPETKNTRPSSGRAVVPKTKPAAKAATKPAVAHPEFPDWVDFEPLADFRLIAWESDETSVEITLTSQEYAILKDHLARLRGYKTEATNA